MTQGKLAILAGLAVAFIWSGWINLSRFGVQGDLSAADITLLRYGTATFFSLPFMLFYAFRQVAWRPAVIISLTVGFPYTLLSFYGLSYAKAASAGVLVNGLMPLMTLLLGWLWLKQRPKGAVFGPISLILLASAMMIWAANAGQWQGGTSQWWGMIALVFAAVVISGNLVAVRHFQFKPMDILVLTPMINLLLFLPIFVLFAAFGESKLSQTPWDALPWGQMLVQMVYQGILVSLGAVLLMAYCSRHAGALTAGMLMSLVPVITAFMGAGLFSEQLMWAEWLALLLCSAGLSWYAWLGRPKLAAR